MGGSPQQQGFLSKGLPLSDGVIATAAEPTTLARSVWDWQAGKGTHSGLSFVSINPSLFSWDGRSVPASCATWPPCLIGQGALTFWADRVQEFSMCYGLLLLWTLIPLGEEGG